MKKTNKKTPCPLCEKEKHTNIFSKSNTPTYTSEIHLTRDAALTTNTKSIKYCICENCGFVFNKTYISESLYRDNINYNCNRSFSPYFNKYLEHTAQQIINNFKFNGEVVVEVGCGDGNFLKILQKKKDFLGYGYDLTLNIEKIKEVKDLVFKKSLYSNKLGLKPKLIVLRHIMEHIDKPIQFLKEILPEEEGTQVFIEVPCWEWILKNNQFFAFNYEHCSYYTKETLTKLMNMLGYKIIKINYDFDGEYLHCFCEKIKEVIVNNNSEKHIYNETLQFKERVNSLIKKVRKIFLKYGREGISWGVGGKGTMLLNLININYNTLEYVADSNIYRSKTYVPITGQKVINPEVLEYLKPRVIYLTNSLYEKEIRNTLATLNINPLIIRLDKMITNFKDNTKIIR